MPDHSKAVDRVAARIKKSKPHMSHREVTKKAAETVRKIERKKG